MIQFGSITLPDMVKYDSYQVKLSGRSKKWTAKDGRIYALDKPTSCEFVFPALTMGDSAALRAQIEAWLVSNYLNSFTFVDGFGHTFDNCRVAPGSSFSFSPVYNTPDAWKPDFSFIWDDYAADSTIVLGDMVRVDGFGGEESPILDVSDGYTADGVRRMWYWHGPLGTGKFSLRYRPAAMLIRIMRYLGSRFYRSFSVPVRGGDFSGIMDTNRLSLTVDAHKITTSSFMLVQQ